jgi:hypothetical protein
MKREQQNTDSSQWMKGRIRSSCEQCPDIIIPSWAWIQMAVWRPEAIQWSHFLWTPWILFDYGLHERDTKMLLHRNKSKTYQNIPDGQTSHFAGLTTPDRICVIKRGEESWQGLFCECYKNTCANCTRKALPAYFGEANFMWSVQSALRCTSVQCGVGAFFRLSVCVEKSRSSIHTCRSRYSFGTGLTPY